MKLLSSVLCFLIVGASCTKVNPDLPKSSDEPTYDQPPFKSETTCYPFVPCSFFAIEPVCGLPKNLCGGAYTFANSCYLSNYNCEHASNEYYQYWVGECYPQHKIDPPQLITV